MKFRRKPVVIDAMQFIYDRKSIDKLRDFCGTLLGDVIKDRHPMAKGKAQIGSLDEDDNVIVSIATEGDWIVRGSAGQYSIVKSGVFEMTFERVE